MRLRLVFHVVQALSRDVLVLTPLAAPIVLTDPTKLPNGAFRFDFTNTPGLNFTVLGTTNPAVSVNEWTSAGTAAEVSPGHYLFTDAMADALTHFYIVRSP